MTFLYDDNILIKFLSDAGTLDKLIKNAQQADDIAREMALKLANNLLQSNTTIDGKDADLFVKDLVSLEAYLNYLLKNERRTNDGMAIVLQGQGINGGPPPEANKQFYQPYNGFFVHVGGLTNLINILDEEAQKPGNQVMKPLVKGLKAAVTKAFKVNFTPQKDKEPGASGVHGGPSFAIDESAIKRVNYEEGDEDNDSKSKHKATLGESLAGLRNTLPFQNAEIISPYDMAFFIRSINQILHQMVRKTPNLNAGPILGQFEQYNSDIEKDYTDWVNFCNRVNANGMREQVPYDRSQPHAAFMRLFPGGASGSPQGNSREAGSRLLQMIDLTRQSFLTIQRSNQLMSIFKDVMPTQLALAKTFTNGLQSFTG